MTLHGRILITMENSIYIKMVNDSILGLLLLILKFMWRWHDSYTDGIPSLFQEQNKSFVH